MPLGVGKGAGSLSALSRAVQQWLRRSPYIAPLDRPFQSEGVGRRQAWGPPEAELVPNVCALRLVGCPTGAAPGGRSVPRKIYSSSYSLYHSLLLLGLICHEYFFPLLSKGFCHAPE